MAGARSDRPIPFASAMLALFILFPQKALARRPDAALDMHHKPFLCRKFANSQFKVNRATASFLPGNRRYLNAGRR
jgi:hypothetical protein